MDSGSPMQTSPADDSPAYETDVHFQTISKSKIEKKTKALSPIIPANTGYSPTWGPKISVKGDYDQFARLPRKEKNKKSASRDTEDKESGENGQVNSPRSDNGRRKNFTDNEQAKQDLRDSENSRDTNNTQESGRRRGSAGVKKKTAEQAVMAVANFPWDKNMQYISQHKFTVYDSLPPRKHAKVEHMKQVRDESQSENAANSPHIFGDVEYKGKVMASDIQGALISHRIPEGSAFNPPVASVVDFLEDSSDFRQRVAFFNPNLIDSVLQSGTTELGISSRLSTRYMTRYLGMTDQRAKNVISSMLVRPILPPIPNTESWKRHQHEEKKSRHEIDSDINGNDDQKRTKNNNRHKKHRRTYGEIHQDVKTNSDLPNSSDYNDGKECPGRDMKFHFRRGTRLRNGYSKYVYRPRAHHSTAVLDATSSSPLEALEFGGEIEDDFDRVVRWKTKLRYCGKPAMYKRVTSPTLGEEALRRKLTDRLPTRQVHKLWPDAGDLYSESNDQNESWRRPPSHLHQKQYPGITAIAANVTSVKARPNRRSSLIGSSHNIAQERSVLDPATRHRVVGVTLPPPQIPERKRRPMWQRM